MKDQHHDIGKVERQVGSEADVMESSQSEQRAPAQTPNSFKMIATMGAVGLVASILLVLTYTWTLPTIVANLEAYLEESIREVLPETTLRTDWRLTEEGIAVDDGTFTIEPRLFAGFREDGSLEGLAIEAQGQGYADIIRIIYGYSPDCACIIGMKVLESRETPGLGDKIAKDPTFLSNFDALDVRFSISDSTVEGPLELIKRGTNLSAWQIDAISGATISSQAITDILNASNQVVLPVIHENLDLLKGGSDE